MGSRISKLKESVASINIFPFAWKHDRDVLQGLVAVPKIVCADSVNERSDRYERSTTTHRQILKHIQV